jgi:hypothetical protein
MNLGIPLRQNSLILVQNYPLAIGEVSRLETIPETKEE